MVRRFVRQGRVRKCQGRGCQVFRFLFLVGFVMFALLAQCASMLALVFFFLLVCFYIFVPFNYIALVEFPGVIECGIARDVVFVQECLRLCALFHFHWEVAYCNRRMTLRSRTITVTWD